MFWVGYATERGSNGTWGMFQPLIVSPRYVLSGEIVPREVFSSLKMSPGEVSSWGNDLGYYTGPVWFSRGGINGHASDEYFDIHFSYCIEPLCVYLQHRSVFLTFFHWRILRQALWTLNADCVSVACLFWLDDEISLWHQWGFSPMLNSVTVISFHQNILQLPLGTS